MAKLAAPGAGLPLPELVIARIRFALKCRRTTREEAMNEFRNNRAQILEACERTGSTKASEQVLIKRLRGMEDSSRNWSIYMTLEHLRIVNDSIRTICALLSRGKIPPRAVSTADVKPSPETNASALSAFGDSCEALLEKISSIEDLDTEIKFAHPWFGPLNAFQWLVLAAFHMRLHLNQIRKIEEALA